MKKMVKIAAVMLAGAAVLAGCRSKEVSFDVNTLGEELADQIDYEDELNPVNTDMMETFLNLGSLNLVNGVAYEGSGATAEEIVVLECASAEDADKAETVLKDRVDEQIENFTDYVPEELVKLNEAVIEKEGNYAVLSVSNDPEAAKKIIRKYMD